MNIQNTIENTLNESLSVSKLELLNESHMHSGDNPESHFKLVLVAKEFEALSKVKRHQLVYKTLKEVMPLFHALALHTYTEDEWQAGVTVAISPNCQGGR